MTTDNTTPIAADVSRVDAAIYHAQDTFAELATKAATVCGQYDGLTCTGPDDPNYQTVVQAHGRIKRLRIEVEKTRKALKADALRYSKTVDGCAREIRQEIEPIEKRLSDQVDAVKIAEAKRKVDAENARAAEINDWIRQLTEYGEAVTVDEISRLDSNAFFYRLTSAKKAYAKAQADLQELAELRAEKAERDRAKREAELAPLWDKVLWYAHTLDQMDVPETLGVLRVDVRRILDTASSELRKLVD